MLLLTRREGESIIIDGHIEITVQEIMVRGGYSNQVRLGITAEKEITVNRKEIQKKKDAENAENANNIGNKKMIPTTLQLEETHKICELLSICKACVSISFQDAHGNSGAKYAKIKILSNGKLYHFSDPDWDTVNKQLLTLLDTAMEKAKVLKSS